MQVVSEERVRVANQRDSTESAGVKSDKMDSKIRYLEDLTSEGIVLAVLAALGTTEPRHVIDIGLPSAVPHVFLTVRRLVRPLSEFIDDGEDTIVELE